MSGRVYQPTEAAPLSPADRQVLAARHQRITARYADHPFDGTLLTLPLPEPLCEACGEIWGLHGCSTRRALARLAWMESENKSLRDYAAGVIEETSTHVFRERRYDRSRRLVELQMHADAKLLFQTGIAMIDYVLMDMRHKWVAWYKEQTRDPMEELAVALNTGLADIARRKRAEEVERERKEKTP